MRAGELRNRIVIQRNTPTRDAFGDEVDSWSTFATLWAKVEALSGSETIEQQQAAAVMTHTFTTRAYPGIVPAMRVSWDSRLFDIQAVVAGSPERMLQLICVEVIRG